MNSIMRTDTIFIFKSLSAHATHKGDTFFLRVQIKQVKISKSNFMSLKTTELFIGVSETLKYNVYNVCNYNAMKRGDAI